MSFFAYKQKHTPTQSEMGSLSATLTALLASTLLISTTAVFADDRMPGVVDRPVIEPPAAIQEPQEVEPAKEPELKRPERPDEPIATISRFIFKGDLVLEEKELQALATPYQNRILTAGDIAKLKYELTKHYFDQGYVLVKVTTPPQDLSDGNMEIVIFQGRIGSLDIEGEGLNDRLVEALTSPIVKGEIFNEQKVETALKDVDDLTNIQARLNLRPGKEIGTTDLKLMLDKADEDRQVFTFDNYGSQLTGEDVGALYLQKSNLFGFGETFGLDLRKSFNGDSTDLESINLSFTAPIGWRNLMLEVSYLNSDNEIGDRLAALDAEGESERLTVALSSNLWNQIRRKGVLRAGIEVREHKSELAGVRESKDNITQLFAEATFLHRRQNHVYFSTFRVKQGIGAFGASDENDSDASRTSGDPRAWIVEALVYFNFRATENDFIQLHARGQYAEEILLSSDLFSIGGYGNVRGFQVAQASAERGASATVEYSHVFLSDGPWNVKAGPFMDAGWLNSKTPNLIIEKEMYSIGLGVEVTYAASAKHKSTIRFDYANPISDYDPDIVHEDEYYLRFTQTF